VKRSPRLRRLLAFAVAVMAIVLWRPATTHVRSAAFLTRFADPQATGALARLGRHGVDEESFDVPGTRARLYVPAGVTRPAGLVVVHGVHWKGIDEPRLQRFARTLAQSGVLTLTPEIAELCDYRIDPASIDTIGRSAALLSERTGGAKVGVMGLSFAGGLAVLSATDPRWRASFAFVVSVGGHDDLGRVLRFFVTNEAPRPDGTTEHLHAHDYGTAVLEYSHVEDFFPPGDVDAARDALRSLLHEDLDAARARAKDLSPPSAARMDRILSHDTAALAPELLAEIDRLAPRFPPVSPSSRLAALTVPLFVLHGAGDSVIPASEAEWLAHDAPRGLVRDVLVSRAIEHVELGGGTSFSDELALVHFMADVLEAVDDER
jgi:dienelactone hydrolase